MRKQHAFPHKSDQTTFFYFDFKFCHVNNTIRFFKIAYNLQHTGRTPNRTRSASHLSVHSGETPCMPEVVLLALTLSSSIFLWKLVSSRRVTTDLAANSPGDGAHSANETFLFEPFPLPHAKILPAAPRKRCQLCARREPRVSPPLPPPCLAWSGKLQEKEVLLWGPPGNGLKDTSICLEHVRMMCFANQCRGCLNKHRVAMESNKTQTKKPPTLQRQSCLSFLCFPVSPFSRHMRSRPHQQNKSHGNSALHQTSNAHQSSHFTMTPTTCARTFVQHAPWLA